MPVVNSAILDALSFTVGRVSSFNSVSEWPNDSAQIMEENHQAELRQRGADISRLEEQLAQCHIQQNIPVSIRVIKPEKAYIYGYR